MTTYVQPVFASRRAPELGGAASHHRVIVVGAGPVGLAAAIDLGRRGIPVLLLDDDDTVSVGSRAICWSKRTLEILDRLGCAEPLAHKGVRWSVGKVFHRDELLYQFDLLPEPGHRRPAFINLQQYHVEECLVHHAGATAGVDLRWRHAVTGLTASGDRVEIDVSSPEGEYRLSCDWLIAADGAKSAVRRLMHLEREGEVFGDRFLIADIHMRSHFPPERWFWFDPPFHRNQSVLLHRQADDVWRIDFQLGPAADPEEERKPERVIPRLRAMLGADAQFEIEWASVYTFSCRRMQRFRHGRVLFAGDAAHLVSPFGARGANSGIQDVDNLVWKLDLVIKGAAPERLLDSYDAERCAAADENMRVTTRSTHFITPRSSVSRTFRDAVLGLARRHPFARRLVNSGRLSVPAVYAGSSLNTSDAPGETWQTAVQPGAPALDAPVSGPAGEWLLDHLGGTFTLLVFDSAKRAMLDAEAHAEVACAVVQVDGIAAPGAIALRDAARLAHERYHARPGTWFLFRPDQVCCARGRHPDAPRIREALTRATIGPAVVEPA